MNSPDQLFDEEVIKAGVEEIKKVNEEMAALLGINPAARLTCVKPSGNASVLLQTASGIHGEHAPRFFRNMQINKEDDIGKAFGRARPATGFSLDVKTLLKYQNNRTNNAKRIFAPASDEVSLQNKINELRAAGNIVVQELTEQQESAEDMNCQQELVQENGDWIIKNIK